jgi:indole-3-glycerol phosphate synthase/phosphoribosylanthranilate isomerase
VPRLKVCGIADAAFAVEAARRGVDCLGLIFAEGSPRRVTEERAREIVGAVRQAGFSPRFVGVFVKHPVAEIAEIASNVGFEVIQLHGEYSSDEVVYLKAQGYEVWRLHGPATGRTGILPVDSCEDAVLLDGRRGTESHRADWSLVAPLKAAGRRVVLAGGISAANIADAAATGADVIDVNSAIESAPGVKSLTLLDELLAAWKSM